MESVKGASEQSPRGTASDAVLTPAMGADAPGNFHTGAVHPRRLDLNFYPFHVGDYTSHTAHLEPLEDLAYRRLLDLYYIHEGPLKGSAEHLARMIRLRDHAQIVQSILTEFFSHENTGTESIWRSSRADRELEKFQAMSAGGKRGAQKRWGSDRVAIREANGEAIATLNTPQCQPEPLPEPLTRTKRIEPPVGVSDVVWQSFLTLRKAKKAPVTAAALSLLEKEASKAGMSLEAALEVCCARGWTGFKAEWLADGSKAAQNMSVLTRGMTKANFWESSDEPKRLL